MEQKMVTTQEFLSNLCLNKESKVMKKVVSSRELSIGNHHKSLKNWLRFNRYFTDKRTGTMGFYITVKAESHFDWNLDTMVYEPIPKDVWRNLVKFADMLKVAYSDNKVPAEVEVKLGNEKAGERQGKPLAIRVLCKRFKNKEWKEEA